MGSNQMMNKYHGLLKEVGSYIQFIDNIKASGEFKCLEVND